ncbi:MAG: hypothetical protein LBG98_03240 [Puniceicoccales bacterium]|jgi:hypothetical protein|nr:hypothetical protein [Puniceicoccales bacterium]
MNTNKKLMATLAGILSVGFLHAECGFKLPELSLDTSCRFDTEYVYRGAKLNQQVFSPKIEISTSLFDEGDIYFGNKAFLGVKDSRFAKYDYYLGASYEFADIFAVDAGLIHHKYRNRFSWVKSLPRRDVKRHGEEIYLGFIADVFLNPSVYYSYDITQKRHNLEGKANYLYDLSSVGANGFAVDLFTKIGYDKTKRPLGLKSALRSGSVFDGFKKGYFYYGAGADIIVYILRESVKIQTGARYEGANAKKIWTAKLSEKNHKNFIWFSTSVECNF